MKKILLVLLREFSIRVRKKSFLLTTILVPLILPATIGIISYLMIQEEKSSGPDVVMVVDESSLIQASDSGEFQFVTLDVPIEKAKEVFLASESFALLHIPEVDIEHPSGLVLFTSKHASVEQVSALETVINNKIRDLRLRAWQLDDQKLQALREEVRLRQVSLSETGEESGTSSALVSGAGMLLGIIIYMMVFLYGSQIMQGIIEEKSSRIVEIIISSVRPFQLMMGKILGIGAVGLVQFVIWVVLMVSVTSFVNSYFEDKMPQRPGMVGMSPGISVNEESEAVGEKQEPALLQVVEGLGELPLVRIALVFLFYFLGGYLLYGALFASVGAAVDSVQDAQQFMFPVTMPLLIGYIGLFTFVIRDPHSNVSMWLSIIPFTSPVCMVGRIAFGVPWYELALSMTLLVAGFLATTWVAGRIYRVGILTTGTKVNWKTMLKWAVMKD